MPKRVRETKATEEPLWEYKAGELHGPSPKPPLPRALSVHGGEFCAKSHHDVAEVDQELGYVTLGVGHVPHPWADDREEHPFKLSDWKTAGWYARYRRLNGSRRFTLTHIWADTWAVATSDGEPAIASSRPFKVECIESTDGDSIGSASSSVGGGVRGMSGRVRGRAAKRM